jgi:hypothetical protein
LKNFSKILSILFVLALLFTSVPAVGGAVEASSPTNPAALTLPAADPVADWDLPGGGHYYTQTGGGAGTGFSITDEGGIPFWSEFKRFGGISAVGYPVSRRFELNGYICQAMQRVIFQWRPESKTVSFVNVFDLLHDRNEDQWLQTNKQVPKPLGAEFTAGLDWNATVQKRLALMDPFPAIKAQYNSVANPIEMNGLPTSGVTDMGDSYTIRCQRIVIQQWKKDMPWAKAGQVTVANGGDIAKEAELVPISAQLVQLPTIQSCGNEEQYANFFAANQLVFLAITGRVQSAAYVGGMALSTPASDPNKAKMESLLPTVVEMLAECETQYTMLKQEFDQQKCVPGKFTATHQSVSQAMQKAIEGVRVIRQGIQQRDQGLYTQGGQKYKEAGDILKQAAAALLTQ